MAETQITRCPHCQTTFRLRLEQLSAAKGAVRCGSCLQVFKAANHFVSGEHKAPLKPSVSPATATAPTSISPTPIKEDIVFDDNETPEQFNDDPLEDFGIRQPDHDRNETFNSSLQLDDSIFSMPEKAKPSRYSLLDNNKKDIGFDLDNECEDDKFSSNTDRSDESWTSNLIDDQTWGDALMDVDDDLVEDIDRNLTEENRAKQADNAVPSLEPESDQYPLGSHDDFEHGTIEIELNSINDLLDEPLKLNHKGKKQAPIATAPTFLWFWLSGALVMLLALVAQVGYFKFDSWSRHPQYRPAYAVTCELLSCKLPAVQDVSLMKTQHFMVRPHPKVKQALYIDTLLINSADYQQPFPDLNLIFTGLNDQTIASRHFKPREYLAGELAGSNSMPLNVPIHIAIEISNPGAEAVGYRIELVANH
ncbi:MAG: putative Zn finger-like uncharacterized protein [Oleispira sp.]|jgi:predicted Zn finger-like uncharacterized protein